MTEMAGELNLPLVDPLSTFEDDFGLDLSQQVCISQATPTYYKLKDEVVEEFIDAVAAMHGETPAREVQDLLDHMKTASNQPAVGQTYDHVVRESLGCSGYIRGDGKSVQPLPRESFHVYREFYRLTQVFLSQQTGYRGGLYRGLYPEEIAPIVTAVLEQPDSQMIEIESAVVSSFSLGEQVARGFSRGVVCEFDPQRTGIAFAPDCFFQPPAHTGLECEFHVLTGAIQLPIDKLLVHFYDRDSDREPRKLRRTIQLLSTPVRLDEVQHQDIADLLDITVEQDIQTEMDLTVQAPDPNERLWNWIDYITAESIFAPKTIEVLSNYAEYVVGPRDLGA
ncbi:hypothetical protein C499_12680 [Halogeometricum borinquense DSM 11551]|uniref:Uncharacterized protein n=2 Tax=Halogeometricum borinquense (strain ATCC 700274 / DSM 11551 / JCM 10706 / KCTC 4070 / PR3) TaxID=469382 RepID=L9UM54_HALBP|nr:hypothetical protein [Halogeometricum borinquense]ELY25980.1 hypothetical protein C499_12680 [Halogeometricum borinquense DSM 11551]